jgi:hypothetical protein
MNIFILLFLSLSAFSATWKTGETEFDLSDTGKNIWVSKNCLNECALKKAASAIEPTAEELQGGKHPGSVKCKKMEGTVIYLEKDDVQEAFCQKGAETVSLSYLL